MLPSLGFGRRKKSIGLDIGSGVIKAAVVDHSKDEPQLERVALRPLTGSAIVDGEVVDPGLVSDTIRQLWDEAGIEGDEVVISVGGRDVIIKTIQMDRMDQEDARDVIRWEAEQHVPFDMDNVQLDFQITDPEGDGLQMKVLLVAAKRELVENKVALVQEAGLDPTVVDVDAFALHNALEVNYPEAMSGITALVSIGHDATTVNILEEGVPVLTRDLTFGTRRLAQDLQRERGVTADEAEAVLRGEGEDETLNLFLSERAKEVARGVERATAFLETQAMGAGIGRLYLCGGGVGVPGLADALAERLGVETRVASAVESLQIKPAALSEFQDQEVGPMVMLSTGLALRRPA
ncbi:MAG TPA: type IV pilus assembly protein PilM [Gemmatimonadota bacterium]|nr:type IV pilus assembly protein PilM [Gemmatimonadota bacterium]